jgi:hypothetical protein
MKDIWLKKWITVSIILLFIGVAVAPSINTIGVKASKAFLALKEREALNPKPVLLELRHFKEDGSVSTQRMIVPYGTALDICTHLNSPLKRNKTQDILPKATPGDWIIWDRNCTIYESSRGCVNFFIGTSFIGSYLNSYLFDKHLPEFKSHDLIGITISCIGEAMTTNGELPDDLFIGVALFRIYIGFVGWVKSINFITWYKGGSYNTLPGPLKVQQYVDGRASYYLAVGIPFYI